MMAHYGLDRGLDDDNCAKSYEDDLPYTPAWQEHITGVKAENVIQVARRFAETAHKTHGRSMVILGAGLNHWYHMDMNYRGIINMLVMCGCIGQSGGGWSHYVGQEKLRPQTGWLPVAFALDWNRPPRHMNSHLLLLCPHRSVALREDLRARDPLAAGQAGRLAGQHDRLQRARRAHGLAALGPAARPQPAGGGCARPKRPARTPRTTWSSR